jgi:hypothetical protein
LETESASESGWAWELVMVSGSATALVSALDWAWESASGSGWA